VNIAGVELDGGRLVWASTTTPLELLDRIVLHLPEGEIEGTVLVAPGQLLRAPAGASGKVLRVLPRSTLESLCAALPGADMPPLGTRFTSEAVSGLVTALDPVARTLSVTPDDGSQSVQVKADHTTGR
jgi:hypothetical protein